MAKKAKMNKFVTGAVTAAMVATAVVPVAAAKDFTDLGQVPAADKANIDRAVELGLMGGIGNEFQPAAHITRGQVAKTLAKYIAGQKKQTIAEYFAAKDLAKKVVPFDDIPANHADQELYQASLIVKDAGAFTGTLNKLNPGNHILRQHMAKVLVNAFGLESKADNKTITDLNDAVAEHRANIQILADNNITTILDGKFNPNNNVTRAQMANFLVRSYDVANPPKVEEAKVESVSAINATEIKVVFNTELNKDSAQTATNYEILIGNDAATPATAYRAVLQDDKKTVILQFGTGAPFAPGTGIAKGQTYQVNVKDKKVLSSTYVPIPAFKDTAKIFADNTAPKLVSSVLNGSTLELTFDEAISSIGSVKVDGKSVPAATLETEAGEYKAYVTISDTDLLTLGSHNVAIYSTADYSGNSELQINTTYTATQNNVKPAVEKVEAKSTGVFRVTFSAPISSLSNANFEIKKGNYTFQNSEVSVATVGTTGKVFDVTINTPAGSVNPLYATGENSVNLAVKVKDFKGTNNVFGETFNTNVTLSKDTVAPKVLNAAVNSATGSVLTVVFDEELDATFDADGVLDSKLAVSKDGVRLTGFTAAVDATDKKKVNITLSAAATDGTYNVTFGAGAVSDVAGNENAAQTTTVNAVVLSNTVFQPNAVTIAQNDLNNVLRVTYYSAAGIKMTDSALNLANYKLDGVPLNSPLFAGADIAFTDTNKNVVEITLPKGQFPASSATTSVEISNNVKDENGKSIAKSSTEKNVAYTTTVNTVKDDVAPELKSAEYVKNNSTDTATDVLRFTFSESVTATDVQDFLVTVGGTVVKVNAFAQNNNKEIVVKLATPVNVAQAGTVAITTDKNYNTDGVINIVDTSVLTNKATVKSVTLSTSSTDSTAYILANPATPAAPSTTFAFDSSNANKLMGVTTAHEYSLDGGTTWTAVTANDQALTSTELATITAANDIKVRVKAVGLTPAGTAQTLNILAGPTTTITGVTATVNTLTGATTAMEYSLDSGTTWNAVTSNPMTIVLASGNSALVRTAATGLTLAGTDTVTVTAP